MMASLDHVGRVVIFRTDDVDVAAVRTWIEAAQAAFLDEYRGALRTLGAADLLDERMLLPLRLRQEVREHLYAVRHLPHWVYVPDLALQDLLPDHD
jgi:maltokinase